MSSALVADTTTRNDDGGGFSYRGSLFFRTLGSHLFHGKRSSCGAPFALNVDQQPSGAVTWGDLALPPLVSVHDRGGNQVPEGTHHIFATLLLPASVATNDRARFNISRPNPSPPLDSPSSSTASSQPQPVWNMWIDTTNTSVLARANGQPSFHGLAAGHKAMFKTVERERSLLTIEAVEQQLQQDADLAECTPCGPRL